MQVRKRDGRLTEFDSSKIENAVLRAFQAVDGTITDYAREKAKNIAAYVESTCQPSSIIDIETIQDYVENGLMSCKRKDVARAYIKYRDERNRKRLQKSKIRNIVREKLFAENVENQNANMDEHSFGGRMGSALSAVMKEEALEDDLISQMARDHHFNNEIYIQDLDHYAVGDHNCLSLPIDPLLEHGFAVRQTSVRPANSISTALQLIAVLFQIQSLQQFGGVSATHLDWSLVPYVRKSFAKHYRIGLKYIADIEEPSDEMAAMMANAKDYSIEHPNYQTYNKTVYRYAYDMLERDIAQSAEAFLHNLNTLQSRSGNQLPFSSVNYGTCTLVEGRLVVQAILECTIKGIGIHHLTPIFPCQIFQCMKGVNRAPSDPNYDLYQLALKCTARRLYPTYVNVDWTNNAGYDVNDPATYMSTMGK